ncbi:hypothetical protein F4859DRAFT_522684 [Xylaria cf. heliscus]|nr:hypothetical protein F4859DRAFT_522684 [Xylaria cf. heliscus]
MSSYNRDQSNNGGQRQEKHAAPATTFDELLPDPDIPLAKKEPGLLKRAATIARQVVIGPTISDRERRQSSSLQRAAEKLAEDKAAEAKAAARRAKLRDIVLGQGMSPNADDLYDLAAIEGVYLNPRSTKANGKPRSIPKDRVLFDWLVARLAGPMGSGKFEGKFLFLGKDKCIYSGGDVLGGDSCKIDLGDETPSIREKARPYYGLCSQGHGSTSYVQPATDSKIAVLHSFPPLEPMN